MLIKKCLLLIMTVTMVATSASNAKATSPCEILANQQVALQNQQNEVQKKFAEYAELVSELAQAKRTQNTDVLLVMMTPVAAAAVAALLSPEDAAGRISAKPFIKKFVITFVVIGTVTTAKLLMDQATTNKLRDAAEAKSDNYGEQLIQIQEQIDALNEKIAVSCG